MNDRLILGAAIGDCVHVAGVVNFLNLAEQLGYETVCLGPAVSVDVLLERVAALDPGMVAVGYRLTPENCWSLLRRLASEAAARGGDRRSWLFGGTEPCVAVAREVGLFQTTFASGVSKQAVVAYLRGEQAERKHAAQPPHTLAERIRWKAPYPLLRHHFGRPTVAETLEGVVGIARAECLDVLSIGTDQNAQEHFFRPAEMDPSAHGAGGVPVRTEADLAAIHAHSRLGNFPLVRCYSGTRDTMRWAPMLARAINNAWCAIPLFWYTKLDGRSPRPLREAIPETQALMRWHAGNGIPVEMNESHHWSLRDAPDVVAVVAAYLAAYNARAAGVHDYVQQLMFNNPPSTSPAMDLGKMLAKLELVESLQGEHFRVWRETRGGLTSYPPDPSVACGHLAATVALQMQLEPHVVHIVGHTEAHHATTAAELIQACRIADGVISQCLLGLPDMTADVRVQRRKSELLADAALLLDAIAKLAPNARDPYTDPETLARAVETGLLDAPHLRGNAAACGKVVTGMIHGACLAVDPKTGAPIPESERIASAMTSSAQRGRTERRVVRKSLDRRGARVPARARGEHVRCHSSKQGTNGFRVAEGRTALAVLLALFLAPSTARSQDSPRAAVLRQNDASSNSTDARFFEQKIRPILVKHCYECHSAEAKKLRGDLRLDSRAGLLKGGSSGAAIVPGKPNESLLIQAIRYDGLAMPPRGRLPDQVVADFERWVVTGAPDPRDESMAPRTTRGIDLEAARKSWPFQPPQRRAAPPVKNASWARCEIDRFILAGLEARGLHPAPDADRAILLRRVTVDLIGLLPTPEEIDAFVADRSPDAFVRVVDRLLASQHFGERWGRHWLDVARYADSNGKDENLTFHEAWRYRDYVIASFNQDRTFDQFIKEQLAGDLLPAANQLQRDEQLIATGFLVLGPKVLFDRDPIRRKMDVVDEQIETVGRAFLGLTLGCARCHDHKFDPIPTTDYYALAGIFASTRTLDGIKEDNPLVSGWMLRPLGAHGERLRAVQLSHQHELEAIRAKLRTSRTSLLELEGHAKGLDVAEPIAAARAAVKELETEERRLQATAPPSPPLAMALCDEDRVEDIPVNVGGNPHSAGPRVPRGFVQVASLESSPKLPAYQSGRSELATWLASRDNPLTARVFVNRVWMHLFGEGLVRSVDNFGAQGERPTHPELLDDLAVRFREDGWSVKKLVRMLVLSHAYQMAVVTNPEATQIDPENKLLWRANLRRLDAEALRDAILCVSGQLDRTMGGSAVSGMDEFATNNGGKGGISVDGNTRRSIYLPVIRNDLPSLFEAFDFADPDVSVGRRNVTTGPAQALYLMNSPFVMDQARAAARRLLDAADDGDRLDLLYRRAFGRTPTLEERRTVLQFLGERRRGSSPDSAEDLAAWAGVCQAVFGCTEFRFEK